MNSSTKSRALRAAAKLAVGVSFGACGRPEIAALPPEREYDAAQPVEALAGNVIVADAATPTAMPDSSVVASTNGPRGGRCTLAKVDGGVTEGAVNCCLQLTAIKMPADAGAGVNMVTVKSDPAVYGCCKAIYESGGSTMVGYVYGPQQWPLSACQACANAIGSRSSCTPWGPAVPPAMVEMV